MIFALLKRFFPLSIAHPHGIVEGGFQMCGGTDLIIQFLLGPAELLCRPQIPSSFFHCQLCLQNDYILCPANSHGLLCQFGIIFVSAEELPHPA